MSLIKWFLMPLSTVLLAEFSWAAQGGPDQFGYVWVHSDEPNGPVSSWIDISEAGSPAGTGDDANFGPFALGFPFSFYGEVYDSVRICTNGFLSFTSSSNSFYNTGIPDPGEPNALVSPYWDDLLIWDTPGNGLFYFRDSLQHRFVVSWLSTWPEPWYMMEAVLNEDGSIVFQYNYFFLANSGTVGIENADGDDGLQVAFDSAYVHGNLAVLFEPPRIRNLTIFPSGNDIVLRWSLVSNAVAYRVYWSADGLHFDNPPLNVTGPPCVLTGEVNNSAQRCYRITAAYP